MAHLKKTTEIFHCICYKMEYKQVPQIKINVMEINTDTVLPK